MLSLRRPSAEEVRSFLRGQEAAPFSYVEVGGSRGTPPAGYAHRRHRVRLGTGRDAFETACEALRRWEMFRVGWVELVRSDAAVEPGKVVGILTRRLGVWSLNACRVASVTEDRDESAEIQTFGFACGTLPGHLLRGEEQFCIDWHRANDTVWYDLSAFSRPHHPLARYGAWYVRRLQRRFVRDSLAAMQRAVHHGRENERCTADYPT